MKLFEKLKMKEEKIGKFSFCVIQKIDYIDRQFVILGNVEGQIRYSEQLYLIGPKGYHNQVKINKLVEIKSEENLYGLIVDKEIGEIIDKGYIFTNHFIETTNNKNEVDNFYLHYLLEEVNKGHHYYLDELLEELALRSNFISIFDEKSSPTIMVDHKKFYPLFSCVNELDKYQKKKECKNYVFSLSDYIGIVSNQDELEGIIINPENKKRSVILNKDILKHIEKVKNKNIEDYIKTKDMYYRKMR